jgi:iron complex outermembrane receptor protein
MIIASAVLAAWLGSFSLQTDPPAAASSQEPAPPKDLPPDESAILKEIELLRVRSTTMTDLPIARSPSAITVLTGDQLRRSGVRFLSDSFRLVPGFEVTRYSASDSSVSARSFNADNSSSQGILGLVDGRNVYNDFLGNVLWEALPVSLNNIERIEVVRGPESSVFGPNAMYGLVNIVTKAPLDYAQDEVFLSGAYGSYDSTQGNLVYVRKFEDTGIKVTLGWDSIEDFDPGNGHQKNKAFGELRIEQRLGEHILELTAGINRQNLDTLVPTFMIVPTAEFASHVQDEFVKLDFRAGTLTAFVTLESWRSESVPDGVYQPFKLDLDTIDAEATYTLEAGAGHKLTAGAGLRFDTFHTADENVSEGRHSTELGWVFVQDEWEVNKELWVTAGVRLDDHSRTGANFSPRLAVVWEFVTKQNLRASFGEGFRNPNLRDFWFDMQTATTLGPATIQGNSSLRAEKNRTVEVAYIGSPMERLRVECIAYYSLLDGILHLQQVDPSLPVFAPFNSGEDRAYGVETQAQFLITNNLSAFANYSYGIREDRDTGMRNPNAPRSKGNVGTRFTFPAQGLSGMVWVTAFDEVLFEGGRAPAYALLNGRVAYDFKLGQVRGQIFIQAFNMLDKVHREDPSADAYGALVLGGANLSF